MASKGLVDLLQLRRHRSLQHEENALHPRHMYTVEYMNSQLHVRLQIVAVARLGYESYRGYETINKYMGWYR